MKCHKPQLVYHDAYAEGLKKLGLFQVCRMGNVILRDRSLIQAFIERWRSETHSFHMPVGEMTITLQDVGCLLGLPVSGVPITGVAYRDWRLMLENCLGRSIPDDAWRNKVGNRGFGWSLRLSWLRQNFRTLPVPYTPQQVAFYTRAYILEFFGSYLFPTTSGDDVPAMYIQFLHDLDSPPVYNWGGAVLAHLYRALSLCVRPNRPTFAACADLLQLWSWTRFACSRPKKSRTGEEFSEWGLPNLEECPPYGKRWTDNRLWENPHNAGVGTPRELLDRLEDGRGVDWTPYDSVLDRLPSITQRDRHVWLARVPLIHFWTVQYHYPDRVMRQFGLRQIVEPPPPLNWTEELLFQKVSSTDHLEYNFDWGAHWNVLVTAASQPQLYMSVVHGPHDDYSYRTEYMQWFLSEGMPTVFLERYHGSDVRRPRPLPQEPPSSQTYLSQSDVYTRIVSFFCKFFFIFNHYLLH